MVAFVFYLEKILHEAGNTRSTFEVSRTHDPGICILVALITIHIADIAE